MQKSIVNFLFLAVCALACQQTKTPEGFQVEPGFTLTKVAAEPLLRDPVDLEFNERGEAMVLEMPGYPMEDKQSRLLVLHDADGDGVYDQSTVFAEGLQLANSLCPTKKACWWQRPRTCFFCTTTTKTTWRTGSIP